MIIHCHCGRTGCSSQCKWLSRLTGHRDWVRSVGVSCTDHTAASGDAKSAIITWDLPTLRQTNFIVLPQYMDVNAIMGLEFDLHQDFLFYLLQRSGHLSICDTRVPSLRALHTYCHTGRPSSIRISRTPNYIATSARGSEIKLWDIRKISEPHGVTDFVQIYNKHESTKLPLGFDFIGNERWIVTGSDRFHAYVYETLTGKLVKKVQVAPGQVVTTTAVSRDGMGFYAVYSNGARWGYVSTEGDDIVHDFTSSEQIKEMYRHDAWEAALTKNNDTVLAAARTVQSSVGTNFEQMMAIIRQSDSPICKMALKTLTADYEACIEGSTPRLVRDLQAFYAKNNPRARLTTTQSPPSARPPAPKTAYQIVTERTVLKEFHC